MAVVVVERFLNRRKGVRSVDEVDALAREAPGAGFADLISDLSDTSDKLRFTLPSADAMAAAREGLNSRLVWLDGTDAATPELFGHHRSISKK